MSDADRHLTEWMLEIGVPKHQIFDPLLSTVGPARSAQIMKLRQNDDAGRKPPPRTRRRRFNAVGRRIRSRL